MVAFRNSKNSKRPAPGDESSSKPRGGGVRRRAAQALRERARAATDQVRQTAAEVTRVITDSLQDEATRLFDERRGRAAERVARLGKVARQAAHALHAVNLDGAADYVDAAAARAEQASDYISEKELAELLRDAQDLARAHPAVAAGGLFIAGFAAARFLKARAALDDAVDADDDSKRVSRPRRKRKR